MVHKDAKECYISDAFLCQSKTEHGNLKVDLQNDFTTGNNQYPKTCQQTLHLLDKYSKTVVPKMTLSEGISFDQQGGGGHGGGRGGRGNTFNKEYWKDKTCFTCGKKGHPSMSCKKTVDDDKSRASQARSVKKKLIKDIKSMKKAFTLLQQAKEEDSDLSGSDSEKDSHFQFEMKAKGSRNAFQFAQMDHKFKPCIAKHFKQMHDTKIKLNLREVILLDSQSTMDLNCNPALVEEIFKSSHSSM